MQDTVKLPSSDKIMVTVSALHQILDTTSPFPFNKGAVQYQGLHSREKAFNRYVWKKYDKCGRMLMVRFMFIIILIFLCWLQFR